MSINRKKLAGALEQLGSHLLWLKEEGARSVVADPKILSAGTGGLPATVSRQPSATKSPSSAKGVQDQGLKTETAKAAGTAVPKQKSDHPVLVEIAQRIAVCHKCVLGKTRTNTVPGQGHAHPEVMFVGEGPGEDEDLQGLAFVGRAGQLLTRMIIRMGLTREEVFIGNIVKCRPPGNRAPLPDEMAACLPYLREQVAVLRPKVIVCLGGTAVKGLLNNQTGITRLRGQWQRYEGIDVMPTYHPSYLLRGGGEDKARWWEVWEDLVAVLKKIGREPPPQKHGAS